MNRHPGFAKTAVVAALMLASVVALPSRLDARAGKGKKAGKDFTYTVSDCQADGTLETIKLELSEGAVAFGQILSMNCIAATRPGTVKVTYAKKGRELEVAVVLRSGVLSDCTCPIGIEGRIADLGKGTYRLSFVFDGVPGNSPDDKPVRRTVATKEFSLP